MSVIVVTFFVVDKPAEAEPITYELAMSGLVDQPRNFTYSELQRFPMVSEVTLMECIAGMTWLYNWTGIPLFFLLSETGVKAGATEVVFYASDGFSSSLTIERALHPTTLLALQANGTVLSDANGPPNRLVVPCKYGYKWVKWITEIEVVDYDYKGTYERFGFSDEADIPNCTLPSTTPPFETFHVDLGSTNYNIIILSNSTINSFDFTLGEQICFNIIGRPNTIGYCYVTIPKELLRCTNPEEWQVWANAAIIEDRKVMEITGYSYVYFTYNHSIQEDQIVLTILNASERARYDIGITDVTASKTVIGQGYNLNITVTIINYSNDTETRNVTVYANATAIAFQNVTLTNKDATTAIFTWNTTGFAKGNYTISAEASVVPNETYTDDNTYTYGIVKVTILGDVDGNFRVNYEDLFLFADAYGSRFDDDNWNPNCDFNGNDKVNYEDLFTLADHYGLET
jgi:hypothetical protein